MISLGLKNEQFLNDSPLEENIIGFETSQNLEWLKTETWRAVVNKFKGPHICTWLLSWRPKKADIQLYHTKLKIKNLVSCQELKGHEKAKQSYIGHGSFFVSALHLVEWSHARDWPEEKATYCISFLRVICLGLESNNDIFLESTIMSGCLNRIQPNVGKVSQLCFLVIYFRKYSKAFSWDQNFRMKI